MSDQKPKLLDQVRDTIRRKLYSFRTEETYLATDRRVAASTQNQALSAILFLYREVPHIEMPVEKIDANHLVLQSDYFHQAGG